MKLLVALFIMKSCTLIDIFKQKPSLNFTYNCF